jgi:O-antigen ligase
VTDRMLNSDAPDAFPREAGHVVPVAGRATRQSAARAGGQQHRLNGVLAFGLGLVIVVSPILLASNRPAFWTLWASVVGISGAVYAIRLYMLDVPARAPLSRMWFEATLFALLCLFIFIQMLPVADLFSRLGIDVARVVAYDGVSIPTRTISLDTGASAMTLLNFVTYGVFTFLAAQVLVNRGRARFFVVLLFTVITAEAVYALVSLTQLGDTLLFFDKEAYRGVATGTFINRNSFATFLAAGICIGAALLLTLNSTTRTLTVSQRISRIAAYVGATLILAAALLATGSRMGMVVGFVGLIATAASWALLSGQRGRLKVVLYIVGAALLAFVALFGMFGDTVLTRLIFDGGEEGRLELYQQVWGVILQRPWTGYGAGSFASVYPAYQLLFNQGDYLYDRAHSTYLSLWFEHGLVAGSLPLIIILVACLRAIRSMREPEDGLGALVTLGVTAVFAVHSLVDFSAEMQANAFVVCLAIALAIAAGRRGKVTSANV